MEDNEIGQNCYFEFGVDFADIWLRFKGPTDKIALVSRVT